MMTKFLLPMMMTIGLSSMAAHADSTYCSSADQALSYSHNTSNGGAPLDIQKISYQGQSAQSRGSFDAPITFTLASKSVINQTPIQNGGTLMVYSAMASGSFQSNGQAVNFSEWVLCQETKLPVCVMCP
jgi:hypothetical protein